MLCLLVSVFVYYVAVRTIVLSRHGSNLARPVIIHDIIHSHMCMPSTPHCGFSGVSPDGNYAYVLWGSFTANSKSVRRAIWLTWFFESHDTTSLHDVLVYTAPGSPWRSPIQLWTGHDVAQLQVILYQKTWDVHPTIIEYWYCVAQHGVNIQHYSPLVRLCMGQSWRPGLLLGQGYTVRRTNVCLMLDQRRRRCSNIEPTLVQNIAWHPLQMISRRYTSSQMSADLICFTTMGVLEFGGHVVRGSSQRACLVRKCTVAAD